jgi:hypothetical protein
VGTIDRRVVVDGMVHLGQGGADVVPGREEEDTTDVEEHDRWG